MNMQLFCGPEVHTNINDKGISRESHIPRNVTVYQPAIQYLCDDLNHYLVNGPPEKLWVLLVPHVVNPEAQGPAGPPRWVITSSSIKICRPGHNRGAWSGFRTSAPPVASNGGRSSITGGRSLLVCRGRAPCRGSVGSSQSSRCVSNKVCLSRISVFGKSGASLALSCGGSVTSSSSVEFHSPNSYGTDLLRTVPPSAGGTTRPLIMHVSHTYYHTVIHI